MASNLRRAWEVGGEGQTLGIGSYRFWQGATRSTHSHICESQLDCG